MSLSQRLCENLHSRDAFVNGNIEGLQQTTGYTPEQEG